MTINIIDLVAATKKEIENQEIYIKALQELKVISGLTHRQHAKINNILNENKLNEKYSFIFKKAEAHKEGSAYFLNLENNQKYFMAKPSTYCEINITYGLIQFEIEKLASLKEAHSFALEKEDEIKRLNKLIEDSKKNILEAIRSNMDIADDFHNKFLRNGASSIYANVNSSLNLSVY